MFKTMPFEEIQFEVRDRIATVTLNRPDKLNAWTARMEEEVRAAMQEAEADDLVRVIILTGAGRGFCAGADMSLLSAVASKGVSAQDRGKNYSFLSAIPKPVIAAVNGPAVGLGFIITLYCDLRFASGKASFGTAFARRGLIAEYGMAWMLPRLIGIANALDLLFSARMIDAAEALRMGLVNRVLPQENFIQGVRAYATELATMVSPRSLRVIKEQVYNAQLQTLAESTDIAENEMYKSLNCQDFREGVAHFLEKRMPSFSGR